jgi:protein-S-isoprenylcysteine O-methyltransferase Ste14
MSDALLFLVAVFCFASFAWGMIWHFGRNGKPSRAMIVTASLAQVSLILQLLALYQRPILFPGIALLLYITSVILFWWAVCVTRRKLAACGQGAVSSQLVTLGPYRVIRHPFYTSYNLAWFAGFAATGWWPLAVCAAVMAYRYEAAVREEEQGFSTSALAGDYEHYKRETGKYLPRF